MRIIVMPSEKNSELLYSHDDTELTDGAQRKTMVIVSPNTTDVDLLTAPRNDQDTFLKSKRGSSDGIT